jgi:hypothetical protein
MEKNLQVLLSAHDMKRPVLASFESGVGRVLGGTGWASTTCPTGIVKIA